MITQGTWEKKGNKIVVFGSGTIAICPSPTNSDGVMEFVDNAHLIAAAPKLLEACKALVKEVKELMIDEDCDHSVGICYCGTKRNIFLAEQVIAEAEKEIKP